MTDRNRYRCAYSQRPDVEKRAMNEKRKILAAEKAGKKSQLFPVPLHQEATTTISTSIGIDRPATNRSSSNFLSDIDQSLCMIHYSIIAI